VFSAPLAGVEGLRGVLLLGAVATALVGGVMCLLQHHLAGCWPTPPSATSA
jgi:hypothetical protein